jgi:hypothetical protein
MVKLQWAAAPWLRGLPSAVMLGQGHGRSIGFEGCEETAAFPTHLVGNRVPPATLQDLLCVDGCDAAAWHHLQRVIGSHAEAAVANGRALERRLASAVLAAHRFEVLRRSLLRGKPRTRASADRQDQVMRLGMLLTVEANERHLLL